MAFFRRIEDFFQRLPANTVHFSEAEEELRRQQLLREEMGPFACDEEGFTYRMGDRCDVIKWADITHIVVYRHDKVCIRIYWHGGDLQICEEDAGWYQFISRMNSALPVTPGWEHGNARAALTTNETVIYQRVQGSL